MRAGSGGGSRSRWRSWAGVAALALGVATAQVARADVPPRGPFEAAATAREGARRLMQEASGLRARGRSAEAVPLTQRALALVERELGPDDPSVAFSLNSLAVLYGDKGDYAQAEALCQRALGIPGGDRRCLGAARVVGVAHGAAWAGW